MAPCLATPAVLTVDIVPQLIQDQNVRMLPQCRGQHNPGEWSVEEKKQVKIKDWQCKSSKTHHQISQLSKIKQKHFSTTFILISNHLFHKKAFHNTQR